MNPTAIIAACVFAVGIAIGGGAAWWWQASNITELQLEYAHETLALERDAADDTNRQIEAFKAAQAGAAARNTQRAADRERVAAVGNGLRIDTAAAVQTAREDAAACPERASAIADVFESCVDRYISVAGAADGHVNDIKTMIEASAK